MWHVRHLKLVSSLVVPCAVRSEAAVLVRLELELTVDILLEMALEVGSRGAGWKYYGGRISMGGLMNKES